MPAITHVSGIPTSIDQILVTTGTQQALSIVAAQLVSRSTTVLVEDPTYAGAMRAFLDAGASLVASPLGVSGLDPDALAETIARERPQVLYIMAVQNPTGWRLPKQAQDVVTDAVANSNAIVIEDRTLSHVTFDGHAPRSLASAVEIAENVVIVESVSKVFWGGLRVGWIRATRPLIARFIERKLSIDLASPVLSQLVAARLLEHLPSHMPQLTKRLQGRLSVLNQLLETHLPDWTWPARPDGGWSLWAGPPLGDAAQFSRLAERYDVTIPAGPTMSPRGSYAQHLRIPYVLDEPYLSEGVSSCCRVGALPIHRSERQSGLCRLTGAPLVRVVMVSP